MAKKRQGLSLPDEGGCSTPVDVVLEERNGGLGCRSGGITIYVDYLPVGDRADGYDFIGYVEAFGLRNSTDVERLAGLHEIQTKLREGLSVNELPLYYMTYLVLGDSGYVLPENASQEFIDDVATLTGVPTEIFLVVDCMGKVLPI